MSMPVARIDIRYEDDIVHARQRTRAIADLLGFDRLDQTRIAAAVSEIARNAFTYGGGGILELSVEEGTPQDFQMRISDQGPGIADLPGILEGRFISPSGMGLGISGARKLMDHFSVTSSADSGTVVTLRKTIPAHTLPVNGEILSRITGALTSRKPGSHLDEILHQNHEILRTMEELRLKQQELVLANRELEQTNRGVVALYAELDEKAEHLNRLNNLKSQFLSNMSHEFRTPLNSIMSLSRILLDRMDGDLTGEQEKQVMYIRKATEELYTLVNDLLDLAKIEAGKVEVHPSAFPLPDFLNTLQAMLKPLLSRPDVRLRVAPPREGAILLYTDEGKVSQILRNLVSNAIKFTDEGEICITTVMNEQEMRLSFLVSDTGVGIAQEDQERIFQEYVQVKSARQENIKGTGLGLPLSKKMAELLGGSLSVQSTPGRGSLFTLEIPVRFCGDRDEPHKGGDAVAYDATRLPVLVVEDDPGMLNLYEKYLKNSGFQVIPARNVREARQWLETLHPLAIVLDILLPGGNGWGFLADIKHADNTKDVPVLIASILEEEDRGFSLGALDFAVKPIERAWLLERLRGIASQGPMHRILVIDDDETSRYILRGLLSDTKYDLLEAPGALAGLEKAREEKPDVIFLDLVMPGINGIETLRMLKDDAATCHIPVIILTAKTLEEEERNALEEESIAILSKHSTTREVAIAEIRDSLLKLNRLPGGE